jgi:acetyl esterase/lipase
MRTWWHVGFFAAASCVALLGRPAYAAPEQDGDKKFEVETKKDIVYFDFHDAERVLRQVDVCLVGITACCVRELDPDKVRHKLDLYLPKDQKDFPVLMFVHGGAWVMGSKDHFLHADVGKFFAAHGIGTAVINYRLTPKVKHPEHIKDVARAFAWTKKNIKSYGGDPDEIFVSGHSAGGHLAALLATDETYLKAEGCSLKDIKGVIPISGVYKLDPPDVFKGIFGDDADVLKKASPVNNVHEGLPPFLIIYAENDMAGLAPMAQEFYSRLKKAKLPAELMRVEDRDHVFILIKGMKEGDVVGKTMLDFIHDHAKK